MSSTEEDNKIQELEAIEILSAVATDWEQRFTVYLPYAKAFGWNAAALLSEISSKWLYFRRTRQLVNHPRYGDKWFYLTAETIEQKIYLKRRCQESAIKALIKAGVIEQKTFGVPCKRYFRLNLIVLAKLILFQEKIINMDKTSKLEGTKHPFCDGRNIQTSHIYSIYNKDIDRDIRAPENPPPPPDQDSHQIQRQPNVTTSDDEHQKLIQKFGPELTEASYQELSEWKQGKTDKELQKATDYGRIVKWVANTVRERQIKEAELNAREQRLKNVLAKPSHSIESHRAYVESRRHEIPQQYIMQIHQNEVEFLKKERMGPVFCKAISFSEKGFVDQFDSYLRKLI